MTTKRPISWFLTPNGRKLAFSAVTTAGISFAVSKYASHTFFLYKYKEFVHYYKDGKPVELPGLLKERYRKCLDIINASDIHRKLLKPFSVFGYDLFHAGSTSSKFGAAIGIPVNFTYKNLEDLKNDDIQTLRGRLYLRIKEENIYPFKLMRILSYLCSDEVNHKKVDWNSEVGQKLSNALILPENVQQFAICREILMTHNNKIIFDAIYPFACVFVAYNLSAFLNSKLNLYKGPLSLRCILYSLVGMFATGTYFLMKDVTEVYYESEVDKKLCELGEDFIESGVIFYQKILERNQALRELMGSEGEGKYSKLGNENFGLRQPRLALVHRKLFFENKLKEIRQGKEEIPTKGNN